MEMSKEFDILIVSLILFGMLYFVGYLFLLVLQILSQWW